MESSKANINLVVLGPLDSGKSTLLGHLIYNLKQIDEKTMEKYASLSKDLGKSTFKYAWVLDKEANERERGLSFRSRTWKIETNSKFLTVIDTPGHPAFKKNMIRGTFLGDLGLLVFRVVGDQIYEYGLKQAYEQVMIGFTAGVKEYIVCINWMDEKSVNWSKDRFLEVKTKLQEVLKPTGVNMNKTLFIPVSAWEGDNLTSKSDNLSWFEGPTLLEALDSLAPVKRSNIATLAIPIFDVYKISGVGTVAVGKVQAGSLKPGTRVMISGSQMIAEVKSIEKSYESVDEARQGEFVGINLKNISRTQIWKGCILGNVVPPVQNCETFVAQIIIMNLKNEILVGYTPTLHIHSAMMPCKIVKINSKMDKRTGRVLEDEPKSLKKGEAGMATLKPLKPLSLEEFTKNSSLGRFLLREGEEIVVVGIVKSINNK